MQKITILCVGRMKEKFYMSAVEEYAKRLKRHCQLEITEIPETRLPERPSAAQIDAALALEAKTIRNRLPTSGLLAALCVEGDSCSSEELAALIRDRDRLIFLIGGSFGLHASIKTAAQVRLSMSRMTFPHHLARVMLLEQIYRACQINLGTQYHK